MDRKKHIVSSLTFSKPVTKHFSSGEYLMILYISRGSCYIELDSCRRRCGMEDMILLKPNQKTELHFRGGKQPLVLLSLAVLPEYLGELSDEVTNMNYDFQFMPYTVTVVRADNEASLLIKNIATKLAFMSSDSGLYGHELFENSLFTMLLVLSLRACIHSDHFIVSKRKKYALIDDIIVYIGAHLTEELSLEQLEKEFFVSKYHICREFKRLTGQTPHAYIVKSRLDLCRNYIEQGKSVSEVYQLGGFGGYNHFFRAFKKEYGVTPKEYYKSLQL